MKNYLLKKVKNKDAQDMVEFTMVLPVLMGMFVMLFTVGQLGFNKQVAFNMAYHACRRSVVSDNVSALQRGWDVAKLYTGQLISVDIPNIEYKIEVCQATNTTTVRFGRPRSITKFEPISGAVVSLKYKNYKNGSTGGAIEKSHWTTLEESRNSSGGIFGIGSTTTTTKTTNYCKSTFIFPTKTLFPMGGWMGKTHEIATSTAMLIEYNENTAYDTSDEIIYSLY